MLSRGGHGLSRAGSEIKRRAINLLARREHTRAELLDKLQGHGKAGVVWAGMLDERAAQGFPSDARSTESYIRQRAEPGYGPVRIS